MLADTSFVSQRCNAFAPTTCLVMIGLTEISGCERHWFLFKTQSICCFKNKKHVFEREVILFHFCTIALTVALAMHMMISWNMLLVYKETRDTKDTYLYTCICRTFLQR